MSAIRQSTVSFKFSFASYKHSCFSIKLSWSLSSLNLEHGLAQLTLLHKLRGCWTKWLCQVILKPATGDLTSSLSRRWCHQLASTDPKMVLSRHESLVWTGQPKNQKKIIFHLSLRFPHCVLYTWKVITSVLKYIVAHVRITQHFALFINKWSP